MVAHDFSARDLFQNGGGFAGLFRCFQKSDVPAHDFGWSVAEEILRSWIPGFDDAVEVDGDDSVAVGVDDCGGVGLRLFRGAHYGKGRGAQRG